MVIYKSGTIYKSGCSALTELGFSNNQAKSILKKLHMHAITCLHNIIKTMPGLDTWRHSAGMVHIEEAKADFLPPPPPPFSVLAHPKGKLGLAMSFFCTTPGGVVFPFSRRGRALQAGLGTACNLQREDGCKGALSVRLNFPCSLASSGPVCKHV